MQYVMYTRSTLEQQQIIDPWSSRDRVVRQ